MVEKNPNYWQMGADGKPLPYADKVTYRVIIDASTQFTEMRAGTADLITNVRGRDVPAAKQIAARDAISSRRSRATSTSSSSTRRSRRSRTT